MESEQIYWYTVKNIETVDSPALIVYKDRVLENIRRAKKAVSDINLLRPHVKTNKIAEVCMMMKDEGILKFKCATISEAEMLGMIDAKDVLLAYQPVGPKGIRLLQLVQRYPRTHFSSLVDNFKTAEEISDLFQSHSANLSVYLDLNVGMNRTGTEPDKAFSFIEKLLILPGITVAGIHAYDGHINDTDITVRKLRTDESFATAALLREKVEGKLQRKITVVAGGSPTFPIHVVRENVECSPGTFVFWDWNYKEGFPDQPFDWAALVVTRVVSIVDSTTVTTDLGHKSVAAERPLPRVHFLNSPESTPVSQSEEHLVLKVPDSSQYSVGDILYGVPYHICPTVALYERAVVVENNVVCGEWKVFARDKKVNY